MVGKRIRELVEENYINGYVLHRFGIGFYRYFDQTLDQVCSEKGLNQGLVVKEIEKAAFSETSSLDQTIDYPIEVIIAYLKTSHYRFIKRKLPYMADLIGHVRVNSKKENPIVEDLKLVFPLFAEDFIRHIYEEEDTVFSYIQSLVGFIKGDILSSSIYYRFSEFSMADFAEEHHHHDDEMAGIRRLTNDYELFCNELSLRVLYHELQSFESELITHAGVENDVLFPKAIKLEKEAQKEFRRLIALN